jgi:transposase
VLAVNVNRCTADQCVCGNCGKQTIVIGYETAEQLDVEPAKYFVRVVKREKRACKACEEQGVQCAPLPTRIIDKGLASDRVIIDTVVNKYADHLPIYRQSAILERETGIQLSRATMDGWVMRVGELLTPIVSIMARELLEGDFIQADETPVGVQMHDGRGKNRDNSLAVIIVQYFRKTLSSLRRAVVEPAGKSIPLATNPKDSIDVSSYAVCNTKCLYYLDSAPLASYPFDSFIPAQPYGRSLPRLILHRPLSRNTSL